MRPPRARARTVPSTSPRPIRTARPCAHRCGPGAPGRSPRGPIAASRPIGHVRGTAARIPPRADRPGRAAKNDPGRSGGAARGRSGAVVAPAAPRPRRRRAPRTRRPAAPCRPTAPRRSSRSSPAPAATPGLDSSAWAYTRRDAGARERVGEQRLRALGGVAPAPRIGAQPVAELDLVGGVRGALELEPPQQAPARALDGARGSPGGPRSRARTRRRASGSSGMSTDERVDGRADRREAVELRRARRGRASTSGRSSRRCGLHHGPRALTALARDGYPVDNAERAARRAARSDK